MCYMVLLSTSTPEDLTHFNTELLVFDMNLPGLLEENKLSYQHRWLVGSKDGCSCGFRHLCTDSIELGFSEPEDWYPEETYEVEGTKQFYSVVNHLLSEGHSVDCIDAWDDQNYSETTLGNESVNLGHVNETEFRFYENYKFNFTA